jgi:hypothetical protein
MVHREWLPNSPEPEAHDRSDRQRLWLRQDRHLRDHPIHGESFADFITNAAPSVIL